MKNLLLLNPEELESTVKKCVKESLAEFENEKKLKNGEPLYTVNQVRLKLKKSHHSIKKFIQNGILRTTSNGLIPESAIEDFLKNR